MRKPNSSVLVLRYSNVFDEIQEGRSKSSYVTSKRLEEQILWLLNWRYYPLNPEEFLNFILQRQDIPAKSYLIIFEGGYKNIYRYAYPIFKRYRISTMVFLASGCIGDYDRWDKSENEILSVNDIQEMVKSRLFSFGSQGKSCCDMTALPEENLEQEIVSSKMVLEEVISHPVRFFLYPGGKYNEAVRNKLYSSKIKLAFVHKEDKITNLEDFDLIPTVYLSQKDDYLGMLRRFRNIEKK